MNKPAEGDIILTQQALENIQRLIDNPPPASERFIKALDKYREASK